MEVQKTKKTFQYLIYVSLIVFILLFPFVSAYAAKDRIAVLIDSALYSQVSVKFDRYIQEVQERFPVNLILYNTQSWNSQTPLNIRDFLIQKYQEEGIKGALLVGSIPYAIWKQTYGTNEGISSVFYEDMDGSFTDTNADGKYDYHTFGVNEGTEIWICWMRPPSSNPSLYLNRLFDKAHNYYTGAFTTNKKAFAAGHQDYDGNIYSSSLATAPHLETIYGIGNVDTDGVGSDLTISTDVMNKLLTVGYEIYDTWQHANSTYQQWDSGGHTSSQIMSMDNATHTAGSLMTFIYGCHSADFLQAPGSSSSNVTCAAAYPFGTSIGQAASGTSWSYGTEYKFMVIMAMGEDDCYLGEAWSEMETYVESYSFVHNRYSDRDPSKECAGNNLIGNPFLIVKYTATGDSDSDGMPDWWEYRHKKPTDGGLEGLNRWVPDADNDNDFDGFNNFQEYLNGTDPTESDNTPPLTPILINPENGAIGLGMTPTLTASAFLDPEGNNQGNSHWQVDNNNNFLSPEWDSGNNYPACTQTIVPSGFLTDDIYYWRVRYKDEHGLWSNWSESRYFSTHIPVTFYVDDIADPLEDGSRAHPFDSISEAIGFAFNGDIIIVLDGTYKGVGNRDIDFDGKTIIVKSENGSEKVTIDCEGQGRGFIFNSGETSNSILDGFTITNGYITAEDGGAIYCENSSPIIRNCVLIGNSAPGGGALECYNSNGLQIINCLIVNNTATYFGAGFVIAESTVTVSNCTFSNNTVEILGEGGGGIYNYQSNTNLINCIVWDNFPDEIYTDGSIPLSVNYSDVKGNTPYPGASNINSDPEFVDTSLNIYSLSHADLQGLHSPCIDAGSDAAATLGLDVFTTRTDSGYDVGVVDMGYHYPVIFEPVISSIIREGDHITIEWNSHPQGDYTVQWSTDMQTWNDVYVGQTGTWTDTNTAGYTLKYYRIYE